ncbi:DUF11 domain-containing protein [Spirosoma aureum]|uniref:DUF11 domain-containing protein n=1 Tax=Spirosoma aureum TaxID=2692134 RepID=A0A6G9AXX5_9BACT|nr:SdrD B-like domain-containing protein [Spirosoma aureum]QIP17043.1 DUF11 domain-containing protein [Spirosoma aureum]
MSNFTLFIHQTQAGPLAGRPLPAATTGCSQRGGFKSVSIPARIGRTISWAFGLIFMLSQTAQAQTITGTVFRDFNGNGTFESAPASGTYTYGEPGVGGITVTGYPASGAPVSTTTSATGQYTLTGLAGAVRVEFTNLGTHTYDSFRGAGSATSVQFVVAPTTNVNFGINDPDDYWNSSGQPIPQFVIPCYINGSRTDPTGSTLPAIAQFGNDQNGFSITEEVVSPVASVGSVWGVGYQRARNRYFFSTILKRHSALGPKGMGGIYMADAIGSDYGITGSFTLQGVTPSNGGAVIDLGSVDRSGTTTVEDNFQASAPGSPNRDLDAYGKVGRAGYGDTDIDNTTQLLYTVNLNQRTLITVDVSGGTAVLNNASAATLGPLTKVYNILSLPGLPTAVNGQLRPWGLKIHQGRGYLGVVSDASTATEQSAIPHFPDLKAYVLSFDLNNIAAGLRTDLTLNMSYRDSTKISGIRWRAWPLVPPLSRPPQTFCQPVLSGIDFDPSTGDMNISFMDRFGHQVGRDNYAPVSGSSILQRFWGNAFGDVIHACYNESTGGWELEGFNSCPVNFTSNANQRLHIPTSISGKGEFFDDRSADFEPENGMGAIATIPGTGRMVSVHTDVIPSSSDFTDSDAINHIDSGGLLWYNLVDPDRGSWSQFATIYNSTSDLGTIGKANGLGDLEANLAPAPIQIGNRVWLDANNNGVQDPGELPLAGVTVTLKGPGLPVGGSTVTTNSLGEYYFSSGSGTPATGFAYNLTGLTGEGSYSLTFPTSVSTGTLSLSPKTNAATGTNADNIDTDPTAAGLVTFVLGQSGQNNFSFDAGFIPCSVSLTATPSACNTATNQYSVSGLVSLVSPVAGLLTITDGVVSSTVAVTTSTTAVSYTLTGLLSNASSHTVTASLAGCSSDSVTYTAPASCTIAPVCSITAVATPGLCATATNAYSATAVVRLTNPTPGVLTVTNGAQSLTFATTAVSSATFTATFNGLVSDGQSHTVTASLPGCSTTTATYTAPASCTLAPVCSITAVATPGLCATATNAYSATAVVTLINPTPGVLTVTNGAQSLTTTIASGLDSFSFTAVFNGLISDGQSHTVTTSLPGCSTTTATYTAPASCTIAPVCSITAVATPGLCATATNAYSATAVVRLTNPTPGVLTVTNGAQSLTFATTAVSSATFTAVFNGLISDGQSHTVTTSLPGCSTTTATYTAPASCTIAPVCSITAVATPGLCATATNAYSATAVVRLTNPTPGVLTVTNGAQSLTFATTAVSSATFTAVFNGLISDGQSHTVTTSLPGCSTTTATYTAPASCTIAPVCSITAVATPGLCATATNAYSATALVTLTNLTPGVLTVTNGAQSLTFATTAVSSATFTAVFNGLVSDGQSHTVTASLPGCSTTTATYTAPASCTLAPVCSITAVATPGLCATATNAYSATALVTLTNLTPGVLTVTNGAQSLTFVTTAVSSATFTAVFNGLVSDGQSQTVTASLPGCSTTTATYTAPASCTIAPPCSITAVATPGLCATATNAYSATALVTLTNLTPGVLTVTNGAQSLTFATTAVSSATFTAVFNGLVSDGQSQTVTASLPGCSTTTATYTAPASCTIAPVCSITAVATPGLCATATNAYSATALVTLINPTPGVLTVTNGAQSLTFVTTAVSSATFTATFNGLVSDGQSHTLTASLPGCSTTTTYTAPESCSLTPTAGLGDFVWSDTNKDGIQDAGESGMPGVVATLFINGVSSGTTLTNATGFYSFTGLTPGSSLSYSVGFTAPNGYTATLANVGDDTKDSDADLITGKTQAITLTAGEFNPTLDAGFVTAQAGLGDFVWSDTNKNGSQDAGEAPIPNVVATLFINGVSSATTLTNATGFYSFTGLTPGSSLSYSVGFTAPNGYTATVQNLGSDDTKDSDANPATGRTQAITLTAGEFNPTLDAGFYATSPELRVDKRVDKLKASVGDVLSFSVVLSNIGSVAATNVLVSDSASTGLSYVLNSATVPVGTTFTQGTPTSLWTVASLNPGQSLTLTFQAKADTSGILRNRAVIPGDTATVCTTIPVKVCAGETYTFRLTAPAGRSIYQWFKDGILIQGQTTNVLNVTTPGSFSLSTDNTVGSCTDFSCCPFIVEEDPSPAFQALATPVTCIKGVAQANGQINLSGFNSTHTYQYSAGSSFNSAASLSGTPKVIPVDGLIVNNLPNPVSDAFYTVRVYNTAGCFADVTVALRPTVCDCPTQSCTPLIISRTKKAKRIGE